MRIFVLNSSGNVGKSIVSREVLYPFMENAKIIEVETVNSSSEHFKSLNLEKITNFDEFDSLYLKIIETENLILDVGASKLTQFLDKLSEFAGIETLFDYFVIPTIEGDKVPTDTVRTILYLKSLGIDNDKIKVVFNNATSIEKFNILFMQEEKIGYTFDKDLFIPKSNIFPELGLLRATIKDIYKEDIESYKAEILKAKPEDKLRLIKQDLVNRMAVAMLPILKSIFEKITNTKVQEVKIEKKPSSQKATKTEVKEQELQTNDNDEEL